jgi:hypothetical protein
MAGVRPDVPAGPPDSVSTPDVAVPPDRPAPPPDAPVPDVAVPDLVTPPDLIAMDVKVAVDMPADPPVDLPADLPDLEPPDATRCTLICSLGFACIDGYCRARDGYCTNDRQCQRHGGRPGTRCVNGACVGGKIIKCTADDDDCPEGFICYPGDGTPEGYCGGN